MNIIKIMTDLYTGKAVDVDRVLLVNYPQTFDLRNLATASHVSLGQVYNVSKALIRDRIAIHAEGRNRLKLMAPSVLLSRWATVNNFVANTKFIEYYSPEEDISKLFAKLTGLNAPEYALTGLSGALLVAPFVRPTSVHIYVNSENDAKELANLLGLMPIEANGNVKFAIAKSRGVFYGAMKAKGVNVVSPFQLYADIFNYPARGKEAASELYKVIQDNWKAPDASINV
jgi:hypothetical protein